MLSNVYSVLCLHSADRTNPGLATSAPDTLTDGVLGGVLPAVLLLIVVVIIVAVM